MNLYEYLFLLKVQLNSVKSYFLTPCDLLIDKLNVCKKYVKFE